MKENTYIHREGWTIIVVTVLLTLLFNLIVWYFFHQHIYIVLAIKILSAVFLFFVVYFFRNPSREIILDEKKIIAPADGTIVVVEEVYEPEYFKAQKLQVSIFMSPSNVHVNRTPIGGKITYAKYHDGNYLVAWHPKSSTENERTSIVIDNGSFDVMLRQIAGKVARRIVYYIKQDEEVAQGYSFGFIKFGSRIDLFLPLDTKVNVILGQKVKGGITIIGEMK
ncbi:MAG: phosphatidylserine decarboxylase family protein [Chitinophagales bacterium]|nr:phosphatidylserine decarboxylase family protein [Chitinophagales bacterium]